MYVWNTFVVLIKRVKNLFEPGVCQTFAETFNWEIKQILQKLVDCMKGGNEFANRFEISSAY